MLEFHVVFLCRQLTLLLRKHFTNSVEARKRPCGLPTLLRVVLKLNHDGKTLRDVINVLLKQLDISWMDTDLSLTQEILSVIAIFVTNLNRTSEVQDKNKDEKLSKCGRMTKMIQALKYSNELEKKALEDEEIGKFKLLVQYLTTRW